MSEQSFAFAAGALDSGHLDSGGESNGDGNGGVDVSSGGGQA